MACLKLLIVLVASISARAEQLLCSDPDFEKKILAIEYPNSGNKVDSRSSQNLWANVPPPTSLAMTLGGEHIQVQYEHRMASGKISKGTVIMLCGGPDVLCSNSEWPGSIPKDMDVIFFDYLGLGQNQNLNKPEQMSIESQAEVVKEIVKHERLKNYVLYGSSFGTAVATVAGSYLTHQASLPPPKMLVLDGVVGNAQCYRAREEAFALTASKAWDLLSPGEKLAFQKTYDKLSREINKLDKVRLDEELVNELNFGPQLAAEFMRSMSNEPVKSDDGEVGDASPRDFVDIHAVDPAVGNHEYRAAGCQVFPGHFPVIRAKYFGGRVTHDTSSEAESATVCKCPLVHRVFDPKDFQIANVPILYIAPPTDLNTPKVCANYHMTNQTQTNEKMAISPVVPHASLDHDLKNCGEIIWRAAIAKNLDAIRANLNNLNSNSCRNSPLEQTVDATTVQR